MKICPKCGTPNQNKNYYCVECNAVLSGAEVVSDEQYFASSKAIQKATKGDHKRKWIYFALFVFITLLIDVYILYMGSVSEGPNGGPFDLRNVYKLFPWYIPIVFTACFNFDWLYQKIRKKQNKPEKHLSDFVNVGIIALTIAAWFLLECQIVSAVMFYANYV